MLDDKIIEQWENIKKSVKYNYCVAELAYNTWISDLEIGDIENEKITIYIPKKILKQKNILSQDTLIS